MNGKIIQSGPRSRRLAAGLSAVFFVCGAAHLATAATTPYFQNFTGIATNGTVPDFTTNMTVGASSSWTVVDVGGNHWYQNTLTGNASGGKAFALIPFPALGPASPTNNFDLSAVVQGVSFSSPGSINYTAGLAFLSSSAQSSGPGDLFVAVSFWTARRPYSPRRSSRS